MKQEKKSISTIILVVMLLVGLAILLYPAVSDYWNSFHQSRAISNYAETVAQVEDEAYEKLLKQAIAYNEALSESGVKWTMTDAELRAYNSVLDITGTGIMGYIEIPRIECALPIYHGTDEGVLQIAIGHIAGSSLPVGGEGTHCIVSGHRGLPSAKLFSDLDEMEIGDTFVMRVLDETFTYEVDQILIVKPHEIDTLQMEEGKDLCTLVTCTPYGINTHRLLVRGHRVENAKEALSVRVTADAMQIDPLMVAPMVAIPILFTLLLFVLFTTRKTKRKDEDESVTQL